MNYKTKINNISFKVAPLTNYRVTKGGKKILTGDMGYYMMIKIDIDPIPEINSGDAVISYGMPFAYIKDKDKALLHSYSNVHYKDFQLDNCHAIEIFRVARLMGEGSSQINTIKTK